MIEVNRTLTAKFTGPRLVYDGKPFIGGICLHDTAGSGTHNDTRYLAAPGDGRVVSVDFTVERDGTIYQLNPDLTKYCTWHAGRATAWKAGGRSFRNRAVTQVLIGIEIVQKANLGLTPIWPPIQIKQVAALCFDLCKRFDLTKEQITTHARIITDGSRSDPRQFPFDMFWFYFNQAGGAAPAEGTETEAFTGDAAHPITNNAIHVVVPGDSLWKIAKQYQTTIEALKAANGISDASNLIRPGQKLIIKK